MYTCTKNTSTTILTKSTRHQTALASQPLVHRMHSMRANSGTHTVTFHWHSNAHEQLRRSSGDPRRLRIHICDQ